MIKKITSIIAMIVLAFSVNNITAMAYVSPTASTVKPSEKTYYYNTSTYGTISADISFDDNTLKLSASSKKGYTFVEWDIPNSFILSGKYTLKDSELVLNFKTFNTSDFKNIKAYFKDSSGKIHTLSFEQVKNIDSPDTSDSSSTLLISLVALSGILVLSCGSSSILYLVERRKEKVK